MISKAKVFIVCMAIHAGVSLLLLLGMIPMVFFRVAQTLPVVWLLYRGVGIILAPVIGAMYLLDYEIWNNPFVFTGLVILNSCIWGLIGTGIVVATQTLKGKRVPNNTSEDIAASRGESST